MKGIPKVTDYLGCMSADGGTEGYEVAVPGFLQRVLAQEDCLRGDPDRAGDP